MSASAKESLSKKSKMSIKSVWQPKIFLVLENHSENLSGTHEAAGEAGVRWGTLRLVCDKKDSLCTKPKNSPRKSYIHPTRVYIWRN